MSVDFENEPVPAMTPRRVGRKLDLRMLYALAAVAAAVVVLILCMTIFFNVSSVEVRGVSLYSDDQIINVGGIYEDMNLVRTDTARAEKRLMDNLVYIDEVKVSKSYPSTVVIDCKEAVKAADIEFEGGYYVLSTSGRILEANNPTPTGGIPIITGFKFYTAQDLIDKGNELTDEEIFAYRAAGAELRSEDNYSDKIINDLIAELIEQGYENVKTIDISSRANIMLNIDNRLDIKLGSSADIGYKLSYFKAVMGKLADNYEGTLIYNGSENGVSAIPKDKYLGKPTFAKDPEKTDTDSSSSDETNPEDGSVNDNGDDSSQAENNDGGQTDNGYDGGYDNGGWTDNTWDNGQYYDNGGWTDNNWDNGQYYDNGGGYDYTYDGGGYGW
ncbi:MAG: FtsQ-type POTRA domain-containing protein [Ruminococcus sp.]|uniref:cell division protein FtsQ/DivIB n=1 Tax=Ruminococcus sp. TaxID=41978 RepID=UPI0025CE2FAD|nr:FtsQ-type POTRA domain-containing protein [Ruminococcus sp.]MBO4868024.1 FtsQ-type POTRA domain-containing protein [Ruminococcus sp.]